MAKEKTPEAAPSQGCKAQCDEQRALAEAANAQLAAATERLKKLEAAAANDQSMKEECLKLLWLSRFILQPCKTKKDVDNFMPKLRAWVGVERAEELERKLRK